LEISKTLVSFAEETRNSKPYSRLVAAKTLDVKRKQTSKIEAMIFIYSSFQGTNE
jgi:hypothetical protein